MSLKSKSYSFLMSFLCLLIICFGNSHAQEASILTEKSARYGLYGNYNISSHNVEIDTLPGFPGWFTRLGEGSGNGVTFGLVYELPLPGPFYIGLRACYSVFNARLSGTDQDSLHLGDIPQIGMVRSVFDIKLSGLVLEPYLLLDIYKGLEMSAGAHINFVTVKSYNLKRDIVSQSGFVFPGSPVNSIRYTGTLPKYSDVNSSLFFSTGYRIPLDISGSFTLSPELSYTIAITNRIAEDSVNTQNPDLHTNWKANNLRFGLALRYSPQPAKPELKVSRKKVNITDTLVVETSARPIQKYRIGIPAVRETRDTLTDRIEITEITSRMDTIYVFSEFQAEMKINTPALHIQVQDVAEAFPLIPAVFFKEKTDIPDSYYNLTTGSGFSSDTLRNSPIAINNNVLNIIAERLRSFKDARITLAGGADSVMESGDCNLAQLRAEKVRDYFVKNWGIDSKRITIKNSGRGTNNCLPEVPTRTQTSMGNAENMRVDISSDDPALLAPVTKRYMEIKELNPKEMELTFSFRNAKSIKQQSVTSQQNDRSYFTYKFSVLSDKFTHIVTDEMARNLQSGKPLTIKSDFTTADGSVITKSLEISVLKDTVSTEVERYSLLLFAFSSDELQAGAERALRTILAGRKNPSIRITGFTDILGNPESNRDLAARRAANTEQFIRKILPGAVILSSKGVGDTAFPPGIKSYDTPVERFLCRTVQIEIVK